MSRRKKAHSGGHERWLVSYADFITLLFAFFVVMFASAQVDQRKVGKLALAMQVAFQQMGVFPASNSKPPLSTTEPMPFSEVQAIENGARTAPLGRIAPAMDGPLDTLPGVPNLHELQKELEEALGPQLQRREVAIRSHGGELIISLREIGFFDSGSAKLRPSADAAFARFAHVLAQRPFSLRIEGHTDSIPIHTAQFASNWELSTTRATEIVSLLISRFGFAPGNLSAGGYAEFHPIASNATAEGRALNRRVDIVITESSRVANASMKKPEPPASPDVAPARVWLSHRPGRQNHRRVASDLKRLKTKSVSAEVSIGRRLTLSCSRKVWMAMNLRAITSEQAGSETFAAQGMTAEVREKLRRSVEKIDSVPTLPTILRPLLQYIEQPVEEMEIQKIVEMVSCDESLTAQCLRIANSPLYSRINNVTTVRGAVLALGVRRLRDLLLSCCLVRLQPQRNTVVDPVPFWQHAFGCALVSRHFAQKARYPDPEKAYLAGLLHDIGELVNAMYLPEGFSAAYKHSEEAGVSFYEAELSQLGYSHCDTGQLLAEHWKLPDELATVISCHHDVEQAKRHVALTALVSISDLLCASRGLDYGVHKPSQQELVENPAWGILNHEYPYLAHMDLEQFGEEVDEFAEEVTALVASLFGR